LTARQSCVTLITGGSRYRLESGEFKMVLDLLDPQTLQRLVLLIILMVISAAAGYAKGFKEGKREGMARRKAMVRHMANKAVK
jgi:hypothetical protein